jgi:exo-beta-1,3-glucanase (GH17 family)
VEAYLIEAGSAPGASDRGVFNVGAATTVSAQVPSGNYYVRVVAINAAGHSAPSSEVAFTVGGPPTSSPSLRCVAFGPYVNGYSPLAGNHPTTAVIDSLVDIIATQTSANCLMTFGVLDGLDYTFEAARRRGLKVIAILWLGESLANDRASIELGALRARQYPDTIVRIACGSELRRRLGSAPAAAALVSDCVTRLRAAGVLQPIGTNERWWSMCDHQWPCRRWDAVGGLDWLGVNVYAWWENKFSGLFPCIPAAQAADFHVSRFQDVRAVYGEKEARRIS